VEVTLFDMQVTDRPRIMISRQAEAARPTERR
jgi:hypothetical protein